MKEYVLGFIFDENLEWLILLKKKRPNIGFNGILNGVGGRIEILSEQNSPMIISESPISAFVREVKEETDLDISSLKLINFGELNVPDFGKIYLFATRATLKLLEKAKTMTDEEVSVRRVKDLRKLANDKKLKGNVVWMVSMAKNAILGLDTCKYFYINEA